MRTTGTAQHLASAYQDWMAAFGFEPTSAQFAMWLQYQYGIATAAGGPLSDEQLEPLLRLLRQRHTPPGDNGTDPKPRTTWTMDGRLLLQRLARLRTGAEGYHDAVALATYVYERDQITGGNGQQREFDETEPLADKEAPEHAALRPPTISSRTSRTSLRSPAGVGAHPAKETRSPRVSAPIDHPPNEDDATGEPAALTAVDRYYLAWTEYQTEHSEEPKAEQLTANLATSGSLVRPAFPSPVTP